MCVECVGADRRLCAVARKDLCQVNREASLVIAVSIGDPEHANTHTSAVAKHEKWYANEVEMGWRSGDCAEATGVCGAGVARSTYVHDARLFQGLPCRRVAL